VPRCEDRLVYKTCLLVVAVLAAVPAWAGDPIEGYWLVHAPKDHGGVIHLVAEGGCIDGRVAALESPDFAPQDYPQFAGQPLRDVNNPDAAKRQQPILGLQVVQCLKPSGGGRYEGGYFYRPEDGGLYSGKAALSADAATLTVRGYLGISLLGRTQTWTRIEAPGAVTQAVYDQARP
jgi:uncharacterized protein (DUF2147 family)